MVGKGILAGMGTGWIYTSSYTIEKVENFPYSYSYPVTHTHT